MIDPYLFSLPVGYGTKHTHPSVARFELQARAKDEMYWRSAFAEGRKHFYMDAWGEWRMQQPNTPKPITNPSINKRNHSREVKTARRFIGYSFEGSMLTRGQR